MAIALFVLGLVLMIVGAEFLVRGASRFAVMIGISPLVVGLTVVAFGTSAPEFAVSFNAALVDQASICVGNVIGSNIFNVLFILGLSSLIIPLIVAPQLIRFDLPLVIGVSVLSLLLGLDGSYGRVDGSILFCGLLAYTGGHVYTSRKQGKSGHDSEVKELLEEPRGRSTALRLTVDLSLIIGGLVMLVLGAAWLVDAAVAFARWLEVSELVIGLTIVSIGTSLPEVVTSVVASIKGERDIAAGNVIGSNLFNLLGVLGLAAIIAPSGLDIAPESLRVDVPVMIAVAVIALPIFFTGGVIARWEGAVLLGYYVAYTIYLILDAANDPRLVPFAQAMFYVAMPLTVVVLAATSLRWLKVRGPASA